MNETKCENCGCCAWLVPGDSKYAAPAMGYPSELLEDFTKPGWRCGNGGHCLEIVRGLPIRNAKCLREKLYMPTDDYIKEEQLKKRFEFDTQGY